MPAARNELFSPAPDAIDLCPGKNPAVENGVSGAAGECRIVGVQADEIGAGAGSQSERQVAERLRTAGERTFKQSAAGRVLCSRGPEITGATGQSLRIFEAAKFFGGVDMDI